MPKSVHPILFDYRVVLAAQKYGNKRTSIVDGRFYVMFRHSIGVLSLMQIFSSY